MGCEGFTGRRRQAAAGLSERCHGPKAALVQALLAGLLTVPFIDLSPCVVGHCSGSRWAWPTTPTASLPCPPAHVKGTQETYRCLTSLA